MKLKFDSNLEYQLEAIQSVTDLFEGLPSQRDSFAFGGIEGELAITTEGELPLVESGMGHRLRLDEGQILKNLLTIQERNHIEKSLYLLNPGDEYPFPNFSVEMETGTGKTYVYLRTIFELNLKYGFTKFIIVVPSVAIREGVLSSIDIMRDHFKNLYNNAPYDHFVYNSKELSKVRQFAVSNEIQIMIINIQAFQKDAGDIEDYSQLTEENRKKLNVIHQEQDKMSGRRPIEFIQATNPLVIIDEPQSVDNTPKARNAIKTLKPLLCLRYSATHINPYNLIYKLDPIKAYDMRLVKQIEVSSIQSEGNFNDVFIRLDSIGYAKGATKPQAKVAIHVDTPNGPKEKKITLKQGTDISQQTERKGYDGYLVTNIDAEPGFEHVDFANGKTLTLKQEHGGMADEIMKTQIRQTVEEHLKKEKKFKEKGIKVLSLFFIDKVANYRIYDEDGQPRNGKIGRWFEEAYTELSAVDKYKGLLPYKVDELHDGYFSVDTKKGDKTEFKDTTGSTKADDDTYHLIMRDKEKLLSIDEPLRFIFSHSALKEGWDNPNVFQICSLREMGTDRERRQTLGRGLRLPVNQDGDRIFDETVNRLTVIASESFEDYALGLQEDIERDCQIKFGRIDKIAFAKIEDVATGKELGQESSKVLWQSLVERGYLEESGAITNKFTPEKEGFMLELPTEYEPMRPVITDELKRFVFKNRIVDTRKRCTLKYNKRVELNEDFKILWEKINKRTKYSVEFKTEELIERATGKIGQMEIILPAKIYIKKTEVDITEAGIEERKVLSDQARNVHAYQSLPDILAYLQKETELTRVALVKILKRAGRLKEFSDNPQAFMTEVAKLINRALQELIIDGIKYERVNGIQYEMRLFQEEEIEEYLSRLYQVQNVDGRTPYDFIPYDSEVEHEIAQRLDSSENVKFFCKLPRWFVVPTPLGSYNPDWAIVTESDQKLYLVRETKSTHDAEKRRNLENRKIKCGQAHFNALGVNYKVATNIHEVLSE